MRWITTACFLALFTHAASASPVFDDQRGQARDTFRDFGGVDTEAGSLTAGVSNDTAANLVRLDASNTVGTVYTQPYEPLSASAWKKVYLAYSAAAANDIALAVYSEGGQHLADLPLVPTAQAGFKVEASLAGLPLGTNPSLRFAITLDGVGAPFAPTLDDLLVTWAPQSEIQIGAVTTRTSLCAGDTFTIDVPVSVNFVQAQGLVVKVDKPVASNNTHAVAGLEVVTVSHAQSATSPGRVATVASQHDTLLVAAGDVYWTFAAPVPPGSSLVLSVTYRVPSGLDNATRFTTRASGDALNAAKEISPDLGIAATAAANPRVVAGYSTLYADNDTVFANQGETITAHLRLDNAVAALCGQTLHDVVVVDDLADLTTVLTPGQAPTAISNGGTYLPAGTTQAFLGQSVTGPAVVWTVASLTPGAAVDLSYQVTVDAAVADEVTAVRTITATSRFDNTSATTRRSITIGLPDAANGGFAIGQSYRGLSEVNGGRDDLGGLVVPSGSSFTYVLSGTNKGLSALEGVYLVFPIPDGLELLAASASGGGEVFYSDAPTGSAIPDLVDGVLGASWTDDPDLLPNVRWVAAKADLVSRYFGAAGATAFTLDIDVIESVVGGGCAPAVYEGHGLFTLAGSIPVGETVAVPYTGGLVLDDETARTAPAQPRIRDFQVNRDVGQRIGAGPIAYTIHVANDGSAIDAIDAGRNAVLAIDLPRVELATGPGYLPLVTSDPGDGTLDLTDLANGKVYVRWPYLAPRSSRDVRLVVDWPAGGLNGAVAELRAGLTVPDDVCDPQTANGATTTTLVVRPALVVTKTVDLDAAVPGSRLVYTLAASNRGDGAATQTTLFERLPLGLRFDRIIASADVGTVYVSNALPPTLPSSFANPAILTRALIGAHFVPARRELDGSWTSPIANAVWVAVDLDDPSLTPPRFAPGNDATIQVLATVGGLPAQSVINNRAALDAADVTAAISGAARTVVSGAPSARVTRETPSVIASGEPITYTVSVVNSGSVTATSLTLTEHLPPGVTFVGATFTRNDGSSGGAVTPTYDDGTRTVIADLGASVGSLEGGTLTVTVLAADDLQTGDVLTFTTQAQIANASNPAGAGFEATSNVRVSTADLQAGLTLDRTDPLAGETLVAQLSLKNIGEHSAANPTLSLRIPADLTYVEGSTSIVGGYALGEPTVVPVIDGGQTVAYDLVWSDLAPTGLPGAPIPGNSTPALVTVRLAASGSLAPETDLPLTLTVGTTTGQGGATANDTITVTATTPEASPYVVVEAPVAAKPGATVAVLVRYGNETRQPAGETAIVVALPNDGDAAANTFVRATATNGEVLYYYIGTPGAALTLPADPLANGWTTVPSGAVTHVAIVAANIPGLGTRSVTLESKLVTADGDLVSGGTHHPVCAQLTTDSDADASDNDDCKTVDVPGLNLTARLTSTPSGTSPGVVVGGSVTHTATLTNTGLAPSFGNWFALDRGSLVSTSTLPTYADVTAVGPNGAPIAQRIPLTVVGNRVLLGTQGGASDPLDYRNVGLASGATLTLTFTGTVPAATASREVLASTFTVGTDYSYDYNPGTTDPELASDNVATASVTAYRPDLFVSMRATDLAGTIEPVARGEQIRWTVTYDNVGDIAAGDATLTSTIASGTAFVVGSVSDVPAGFVVEYLGPSGWGYTPTGAAGTTDTNVRALRMSGSDLATPLNPTYSA
ncbi:MAG: DUF11 domain-containing protein, partial [Deltaproteobacteria bacterium]|nr:DUF11 domain-containing protein [Deltaproteobacteria bacterium]